MTTATAARCDANTTKVGVTEWGTHGIPCQTTRGLRTFLDHDAVTRFYCSVPDHRLNVERRFGRTKGSCTYCGEIDPILAGLYRRFVDPRGGIFIVCDDCAAKADDEDEDEPEYDLNPEGDPTRNGAFGG